MKRAGFAVALMLLSAAPSLARPDNIYEDQSVYVNQRYGGSSRDPWVGANRRDVYVNNQDTNSCVEGSVIGGLLGAGIGAALSRGNGRWVGFPLVVPLALCWAAKWMGADAISAPRWSRNWPPRWQLVRGFASCANSLAHRAHLLAIARVGSSRHQAAA